MDSKDERKPISPQSTLNGIPISILLAVYEKYTQEKRAFPNYQEFYLAGYQEGIKDFQTYLFNELGIEPEKTILN